MHEIGSSNWYRSLVERCSHLTVVDVRVFTASVVTILVEEHDQEAIALTGRVLATEVSAHMPGTRACVVSLQTFEQDARITREARQASAA